MMRSLKIISAAALLLLAYSGYGQVIPQFSQYYQNYLIHNPGAAGMEDYWEIKTNFRKQWSGLDNTPISGYLTFSGGLNTGRFLGDVGLRTSEGKGKGRVTGAPATVKHGLGGYVIVDNFGPMSQYAGGISYAAHIKLFSNVKLSIGTSVGLNNFQINGDPLTIKDPNDNTYQNYYTNGMNQTFFDWNVGMYFYSPRFFVGYGANHILGNMIYFGDQIAEREIAMHHFITGGYKFKLGKRFELMPSVQVKFMTPAPVSFDITARLRYNKMIWAGVSYRNESALSFALGGTIARILNISYSYDYTLNNIRSYSWGSHEVILGFNIGAGKRQINQYTW